MRQYLFVFVLSSFLCLGLYAQTNTNIQCDSQGIASCLTSDGMCVDFFEGNMDADMWEGMCQSLEGEFSETACDKTNVVMSCLNKTNPIMALTHFTPDYDLESAQQMCTVMGGTICQ